MIKKYWKQIGICALALLVEYGLLLLIDEVTNNVVRIGGAIVFIAIGLFLLFMVGRVFFYWIRNFPAQMTALGIWVIVLIMIFPFLMILRTMPF